jgi:hypothetical protein
MCSRPCHKCIDGGGPWCLGATVGTEASSTSRTPGRSLLFSSRPRVRFHVHARPNTNIILAFPPWRLNLRIYCSALSLSLSLGFSTTPRLGLLLRSDDGGVSRFLPLYKLRVRLTCGVEGGETGNRVRVQVASVNALMVYLVNKQLD